MAATADNLITMVRRLPDDCVWQVIAIGRANLELTAIGLALGGNARAGLEDTLYLRKGEQSPGNLPLVQRAVDLAAALDRPTASVEETRPSFACRPASSGRPEHWKIIGRTPPNSQSPPPPTARR